MKKIQGFENYAVDESGNVFNIKRQKKLAQEIERNGYVSVALWQNGYTKRKKVHRLVAEAYIPNPDGLPCVNHKDENKQNNCVGNLEWCSFQYNNHYGNNKPTVHAINARKRPVCQYTVDGELVSAYESASEAQRKTGIMQQNISKCCLRRKNFRTAGGFVWKFEERNDDLSESQF